MLFLLPESSAVIFWRALIFNRIRSAAKSNSGASEFQSLHSCEKDEISILQVPLCHKGVGVLCVSLCHVLFLSKPFD